MSRKSLLRLSGPVGNYSNQSIIDAINKLENAVNNTASYLFIDNETPAGIIDGTNKIFTLANNPNPNLSLELYLNGVYQSPLGEDYNLSGTTITFIEAPLENSIIRAFYRYK